MELLRIEVRSAEQAAALRILSGRAARLLGLGTSDETRVATSVSELARVAQSLLPLTFVVSVPADETGAPTALAVTLADAAGRLHELLPADDGVRAAVSRLMDSVAISPAGVTLLKLLPAGTPAELPARVGEQLALSPRGDLKAALERQHEELLEVLLALRERETELVGVNEELAETNRGVVALYAQLEQSAAEVRHAQRLVFEELEDALRPPPPDVPGLELAIRYVPAQSNSPTGGDLYDWFVLPDGTLHVTVVDVQGHGVTSTRDALMVTHAVRTLVLEGHNVGKVLARVDSLLQNSTNPVVASALVVQIDPVTGGVHIAGAGHPPALGSTADGADYLEAPGRPLGYPLAGSDETADWKLGPADTLLLYTDGIIEIRRDIIEGMDTLRSAAAQASGQPLDAMLDTILSDCTHGHQLVDDTLLLGIRRSELRDGELGQA